MAVEFKLRKTKGETASGEGGSVRSFSQSEKRGYIDYINQDLAGDPDIPALPVSLESDDIFTVISEGILFWYAALPPPPPPPPVPSMSRRVHYQPRSRARALAPANGAATATATVCR